MRRRFFVLALLALCGCRDFPDPRIVSVEPAKMIASETTSLAISAELPLPTTIDYAEAASEVDTRATLRIGDQELGSGQTPTDGVFRMDVPTLFAPGQYDVTLTLGDGREAVVANGFTVEPGAWPEGYTIDPVGPQQRFVPFNITVRATGANAAIFRGNVRLSVPAGASIGPALSGTFVDGVLTQQVVVSSTRAQELIIVTDVAGNRATSNEFTLQ